MTLHRFHSNDSAILIVKNRFRSGWQSLATAAELVQSHRLRHRWFPSLCSRGSTETIATVVGSFLASPLLPPGSRGITCLSAPLLDSPSYNPSALAALVWIEGGTFKILQKWDCSGGMYLPVHCCKLWEAVAALIALLLPDERRRVVRSHKSTDVKAISAFSVILHINRNVVKCFFVPFSIWHFSTSCKCALGEWNVAIFVLADLDWEWNLERCNVHMECFPEGLRLRKSSTVKLELSWNFRLQMQGDRACMHVSVLKWNWKLLKLVAAFPNAA